MSLRDELLDAVAEARAVEERARARRGAVIRNVTVLPHPRLRPIPEGSLEELVVRLTVAERMRDNAIRTAYEARHEAARAEGAKNVADSCVEHLQGQLDRLRLVLVRELGPELNARIVAAVAESDGVPGVGASSSDYYTAKAILYNEG